MKKILFTLLCMVISVISCAQQVANRTDREEWFMDLGFGMVIHRSMDSQLGLVINHSMAGASDDYLERFVNELPATYKPSVE